jgi:hypothetical protein
MKINRQKKDANMAIVDGLKYGFSLMVILWLYFHLSIEIIIMGAFIALIFTIGIILGRWLVKHGYKLIK